MSLRTRVALSTSALMTVVMLLLGVGVQLALAATASRDLDRVVSERARTAVTLVENAPTTSAGTPRVPTTALDAGVVVYDGAGTVLVGSVSPVAADEAERLADDLVADGASATARTLDVDDETRLRAVPYRTADGGTGAVVVSEANAPYERSERYALAATVLIGLVVVALTALLARRATSQALAPVRRMAASAAEWSEHDLGRRFQLDPSGAELAVLAETLDHLLDRVAEALRAEQRLTAELAHELRTPLTVIRASADLALIRGIDDAELRQDVEAITRSAQALGEVVTLLLETARTGVGRSGSTSVDDVVALVRAAVPADVDLVVHPGAGAGAERLAAPAEAVLRALAPLLDNAARHTRSTVTVAVETVRDHVEISVADDGAGIARDDAASVFEPGTSGSGSSGLGLGIARRVARSLGGDVVLLPGGPTTFVVRLPRG